MFFVNKNNNENIINSKNKNTVNYFTKKSTIADVINNEAFRGFGNLIFPVDRNYNLNTTLDDIDDIYLWYNYIDSNTTVNIVNYLKKEIDDKNQVFYPIYTKEQMNNDSDKENVGLFFFRGKENAKTAIVNAGGGFMYVGAMADSFPQALEISKKGYNAFALIYRPETAMEDLARAIAFIHDNAENLKVDMSDYSVWGGSAGGRMASWIGTYGTESFGEKKYPKPATVIMQYTSLTEVTGNEVPTYNCVGTNDSIVDYRIMEQRIDKLKQNNIDAEIEIFEGLSHGFGLGIGTKAEGWLDNAIKFWEKHIKD